MGKTAFIELISLDPVDVNVVDHDAGAYGHDKFRAVGYGDFSIGEPISPAINVKGIKAHMEVAIIHAVITETVIRRLRRVPVRFIPCSGKNLHPGRGFFLLFCRFLHRLTAGLLFSLHGRFFF